MTPTKLSPLRSLRSLIPTRRLAFEEALRIAELQAAKLVELINDERGILALHLADMPRLRVVYERLPVSGMSYWNGSDWIIAICASDSAERQRFTLLHEFKHIVDHGSTKLLYRGDRNRSAEQQAEAAADYFAGCALVGKRPLKAAWGRGIQRVADLASYFDVSQHAIRVRLAQTGLDVVTDRIPAPRCARPVSTPARQAQRFRPAYTGHAQRS